GKIIPTQYDKRNKICRQSLMEIQNISYEKVTNPIRVNSKVKECVKQKKSIFSYAPSSPGAQDFKELVRNVLYGVENDESDTSLSLDIKEGRKALTSKS
ncbi:MAG: ParA family protein, partial [Candidatus Woesearchaeota archaeon]